MSTGLLHRDLPDSAALRAVATTLRHRSMGLTVAARRVTAGTQAWRGEGSAAAGDDRVDLAGALLDALTWEQRRLLDTDAPTHVAVPSGSRIPVDYADPAAPVLAVRLQELFGLAETPRVARGRVPLTLHLLSPARRPVQVTSDLAGFWRGSYFDVRKELRGRYPKHPWPDDPASAVATSRTKPRKP